MKKPKIKDIHGVLFLNEKIRIGSGLDYAIEIENPSNKYSELIKNMTGEKDLNAIISDTTTSDLNKAEILDAISALTEAGYVEDASSTPPRELSPNELERYKVNINFFNTLSNSEISKYDYQIRLKNSHIVIFGIGGIGSNICLALAELGIGKITAIDFDVVELSNLNRQILYSTVSLGKLKTEEANRRSKPKNKRIQSRN